jgi:hypothetical protein
MSAENRVRMGGKRVSGCSASSPKVRPCVTAIDGGPARERRPDGNGRLESLLDPAWTGNDAGQDGAKEERL